MREQIKKDLKQLMLLPGLSGHEDRVRRAINQRLLELDINTRTDTLGNLFAHFPGNGPRVMLFTHMDQLGFVVRKIETNGLLRLERVGGVPERALPAQSVLICVDNAVDVPGVIAHKSHHATLSEEKYLVTPYPQLYVDTGHVSLEDAMESGIRIGQPVVYEPYAIELANNRICGTSVDDRAGCAVLLAIADKLQRRTSGPPVDLVFTVQEEFNLRGALPVAQQLRPEIAIQIDLMLASDTPDMASRGDMHLGGGPGMSLYSFHGRGTLNGVIPHPALVSLFETTAAQQNIPLQRSAQSGVLTDLSYVQLSGHGVASIDLGFPLRSSHSAREVCDLDDLVQLTELLNAAFDRIDNTYSINRDDYT